MRLIPDWRRSWRFWSVRLNILGLLLLVGEQALPLWGMVPAESRGLLPRAVVVVLPLILFALATAARVIRQEKLDAQPKS